MKVQLYDTETERTLEVDEATARFLLDSARYSPVVDALGNPAPGSAPAPSPLPEPPPAATPEGLATES